jgi:hypothetical protein
MLLVTCGVALTSLALAWLVLAFGVAVLAALVAWLVVVCILVQPRWGLYLIFAVVLSFEGSGDDPLMLPGVFLDKSLQSTLGANGGILIPLEILLLLTVGAWLAHGLMRHGLRFRGGDLGRPMLFFLVFLVYGVVRGLMSAAILNYVFWESRFLFAMVLCYMLAANTIRTPGHVRTLLKLIALSVGFSAIEGTWRKFALIDTGLLGQAQEVWYSHEDVVIWGLLIFLVLAYLACGGSGKTRVIGLMLLFVTVFSMLVSERRAGYIGVMIAFVAFAWILFLIRRKAFYILVVPLIIGSVVYFPLFWNNTGTLGQPARAVRSLSDPDPRDAASNEWRVLEAINVRATILSAPLGIGFGQPFLQVVTVPDISSFIFWDYESHHDILWVWMKTGALGFIAFFVVMGGGIALGARLARELPDRHGRAMALVTVAGVIMTLVYCYVDLGLTGPRLPIVVGTLLGTLSVLTRVYQDSDALAAQSVS